MFMSMHKKAEIEKIRIQYYEAFNIQQYRNTFGQLRFESNFEF